MNTERSGRTSRSNEIFHIHRLRAKCLLKEMKPIIKRQNVTDLNITTDMSELYSQQVGSTLYF